MTYFWQTLQESGPIIGLSPMDGVTDHPFRFITKKYGNPDIVFTEFTSVEGLCRGATKLTRDFIYDESQRPIIAQVYGSTPDFFRQAAVAVCSMGFDGMDINMGCPAKNVAHSGVGAGLIRTPQIAQAIMRAALQGVREWSEGLSLKDCPDIKPKVEAAVSAKIVGEVKRRIIPVSVKTRIGYAQAEIETWLPYLLETQPAAITIHGRTLKQLYTGLADWEQIGKAVEMAAQFFPDAITRPLMLGNGDIHSRAEALERVSTYKLDGALIGRASFGNPFVFSANPEADWQQHPWQKIAVEHSQKFEETFGSALGYSFVQMRKLLLWYAKGFDGAKELRQRLALTNSAAEVQQILI